MVKKKILVIGTYPIKNPQHGGQKRAEAIVDIYRKNFSQVRYCGVFFKGFYKDYDRSDIQLSKKTEQKVINSPFTGDIVIGQAIVDDAKVRKRLIKLLTSYKPDIIHIEQPFPFLGLESLLKQHNIEAKIVFGSQNIEGPMKRDILENAGFSESDIKPTIELIENLEIRLTKKADLTVACTQNDLSAHKEMGANDLVLAPNGIQASIPKESEVKFWQYKFQEIGANNVVLFVGSAHPPNWVGFFDMVGKGLGFLSNDTRIVIAGSICDYFEEHITPKSLDVQDATFWQRAYSAGRLSQDSLDALIQTADVIILPITEGGGSNLKTAEAIIADKKIVATDHALRSFEWFRDFPNVWIANDRNTFQTAILEAVNTQKTERNTEQSTKAQDVDWDHTLAALVKKVGEI